MVFQGQEVFGRGNAVHRGHAADRAFGHVDGHRHAVLLGQVADLLVLEDAARGEHVGVDDRNAAGFEQRFEAFLQVDVFAGADRDVDRLAQAHVLVGVLPGDHVLDPGQVVFFQALAQADAVLQGDMAEVVGGQRDGVADDRAHIGHVFLQQVDAVLGQVDAGEWVGDVVNIVTAVAQFRVSSRVLSSPAPAVAAPSRSSLPSSPSG